jgi:Caspase domain
LIGAADYSEGFARLPAVRNDIQMVASALASAGYEIEVCSDDVTSNAVLLDDALGNFCRSGGTDDIRLLYFSGHGMRLDNADWIIPANTRRQDAIDRSTRRVSTDLSATVAASAVGLVVFVIDACRNLDDAPVAKGVIGAAADLRRPAEARFVRFFGCASSQVCQTIGSADAGSGSSLFTAALVASLENPACVSLETLQLEVERYCKTTIDADAKLLVQTPILSYGETSSETRAVLQRPIFERAGPPLLSSIWPKFETNKLHCLLVVSEYQVNHEFENGPTWGPVDLVNAALVGACGDRIWHAFRIACDSQKLSTGESRKLAEVLTSDALSQATFSVLDAFANGSALELAIRALVEADLVVFDVTNFEPAMMLLLGVRSACRRALTVCSHGGEWSEGMPLELPFNLQDLNVNSHKAPAHGIGDNLVVERFVRRVETGFLQLSKHPAYLDLPGYEELRQLGSESEAVTTISVQERVLVLCSYSGSFFANWQYLRDKLTAQLSRRKQYNPKIERVIDYGTSQLVRQGLYEQIRRVAACVTDWTELRASVFLELGARLAISPYGAVQLIDERWLPGGPKARGLKQIALMQGLLEPLPYTLRGKDLRAFEMAAVALLDREPGQDENPSYNRIYRVLWRAIGNVQPAILPVAAELKRRADALYQSEWDTVGKSPGLFTDSQTVKLDNKRAALELRLAAWLYLEHGIGTSRLRADPPLGKLYRELGTELRKVLADMPDPESRAMGRLIKKRLESTG